MGLTRRTVLGATAGMMLATLARAGEAPADRPNFLWITCEDSSSDLGCFGCPDAITPNLDAFARGAVRFTRAFSSAPVCSPVRSGIITGMYATSLGTQRLRSQFPVPRAVRPFTAWLREAGYYCSNNVKTDYNLANEPAFIRDGWDESSPTAHWRARKPGQPFFSIFNLMTTHQSFTGVFPYEQFEKQVASKLSANERHDPAKVTVPPYYPDTPEVRRTLARYHDCVTLMDRQAAEILKQLEADGLADNTIVFFYPDHGRGLPRGKRTLYDSGLQVPLMIRFPARYQHLAPAAAGASCDRMVSTIDFGPTLLSLAGVAPPAHMQGIPFLGASAGRPRTLAHGARDRVDEAFDLSRSARDGRYLYIRNYMPHLPGLQPEGYSDQSDMRRELKRLAADGKLNSAQLAYAGPRRPLEELFDTQADPHQVHNLAESPQHKKILDRMRGQLRQWILATRDAGFVTEPLMRRRMNGRTPREVAADEAAYPLQRLLDAADLVGRPEAVTRQIELMADAEEGVRYWAAVGLHAARNAVAARDALRKALADPSSSVRIESAAALAGSGDTDAVAVLERELRGEDMDNKVHAARALQLLGDKAAPALPAMREVLAQAKRGKGDGWMYVGFCLEEAVGRRP